MTELTFALLKYGFLILLWVFAWFAVRSLHKDIESFSPRPSRSRRRKERHAARKAAAPAVPVTGGAPVVAPSGETPRTSAPKPAAPRATTPSAAGGTSQGPTLLVIIDGPLAGSSVPLTGEAITLGRAASNTVVLDDEFVSSHHARVYADPLSGQWAIEDLGSTNGTVVNGQRLTVPTVLPARVPVRIGATTFELR